MLSQFLWILILCVSETIGKWEPKDDNIYYFSEEKATYFESHDHCISKGGNLASVSSQREHSWLVSHMIWQNYWIGLWLADEHKECSACSDLDEDSDVHQSCINCRKKWTWQDGHQMVNQDRNLNLDKWFINEPSGGQNCARLSTENGGSGFWKDVDCEERYFYICKQDNPCFTQEPQCNGDQCTLNINGDSVPEINCICSEGRTGTYCENRLSTGISSTTVISPPVTPPTTSNFSVLLNSTASTTHIPVKASKAPSSDDIDTQALLIGCIATVLVIALLGVFVTICCFSSQRAKRKKYEAERARIELRTISHKISDEQNGTLNHGHRNAILPAVDDMDTNHYLAPVVSNFEEPESPHYAYIHLSSITGDDSAYSSDQVTTPIPSRQEAFHVEEYINQPDHVYFDPSSALKRSQSYENLQTEMAQTENLLDTGHSGTNEILILKRKPMPDLDKRSPSLARSPESVHNGRLAQTFTSFGKVSDTVVFRNRDRFEMQSTDFTTACDTESNEIMSDIQQDNRTSKISITLDDVCNAFDGINFDIPGNSEA